VKEAHLAASDMLEWLAMTDNAALAAPGGSMNASWLLSYQLSYCYCYVHMG